MQKPKIVYFKNLSVTDSFTAQHNLEISWYSLQIFVMWYKRLGMDRKKYYGFRYTIEF